MIAAAPDGIWKHPDVAEVEEADDLGDFHVEATEDVVEEEDVEEFEFEKEVDSECS